MVNLLEFKNSDPGIGISTRAQIEGPESVLVNEFVEQYASTLCALKKHYALFYEPLLPTGYPDLVIVTYKPHKYESWADERSKLSVLELKVLHHLYFVGGSTSMLMEQQLGLESRLLLRSLERLMDASMVKRSRQKWFPMPLSGAYGISNIKTIEAKISDWQGAISQAGMNRWFSSESYILSPVSKPSRQVLNSAKTNGIGIYSMPSSTRARKIQKPERLSGLPVSYASWLFNEWIGRQLSRNQKAVL